MTASYKTKVRVTQQQQVKQVVKHETFRIIHDDLSTIADDFSGTFSFPTNSGEATHYMSPMSTKWITLPFAFPVMKGNQRSKKINDILSFSLQKQSEDEVSNNAGFVIILISRCLNAVGVNNQVDCGYRQLHGESLPHIWLFIDGYVIDNAYIKELTEDNTSYLCKNTPKCYKNCDFSSPEIRLPNINHNISSESLKVTRTMQAIYNFYKKKPDKALALGLNREQLFNFYFTMIRYMYDNYDVCITGIDPKIRFMCWRCECYPKSGKRFLSDILGPSDHKEVESSSKSTWKFSHCSLCMVASYCSPECQKLDWEDSHKITCFSRVPVYLSPLRDTPFISHPPS